MTNASCDCDGCAVTGDVIAFCCVAMCHHRTRTVADVADNNDDRRCGVTLDHHTLYPFHNYSACDDAVTTRIGVDGGVVVVVDRHLNEG